MNCFQLLKLHNFLLSPPRFKPPAIAAPQNYMLNLSNICYLPPSEVVSLYFLSVCSLTDVTSARRHSMWSSTSLSTSPHTPPRTSPVQHAIKSSHASPVSNLTSCCTRGKRSVPSLVGHQAVTILFSLCSPQTFLCVFASSSLLCNDPCRT